MRRVTGIAEASEITGLSQFSIRQGCRAGRYPHMRVNGAHGKILIDIDLLQEAITREMLSNATPAADQYGKIRPIAIAK